MKRQIAIGDIHGCYSLLRKLIEKVIRFSPGKDMLVFLGDYIDRQRKSKEVVEYVMTLREKNPYHVILLKGNHEDLAFNALNATEWSEKMALWMINGGDETIRSYGKTEFARSALIPFIESLKLYHETDTHIFVHGGIPGGRDLKTVDPEDLMWDRDFSYHGEKTLVVGHTPQIEAAKIPGRKIICVDTGAFMTGVLSAYDVVNNKFYKATTKK